ncbi:hypothetical protein EV714DRAFT_270398 [Schizophyllum commune]
MTRDSRGLLPPVLWLSESQRILRAAILVSLIISVAAALNIACGPYTHNDLALGVYTARLDVAPREQAPVPQVH